MNGKNEDPEYGRRICRDCGLEKNLAEFTFDKKRPSGRGSYCRPCMALRHQAAQLQRLARAGRTVQPKEVLQPGTRRCPDCGLVKELSDFPRNKNSPEGRHAYCKPCHNARGKETKSRLYGGSRHYHLMRRYGISAAQAETMLAAQGGTCAVCKHRPAGHIDHCHEYGNVRGALCFACNGGLGLFSDNPDVLRRAIAYLETTTWQRDLVAAGVYRLRPPMPAVAPEKKAPAEPAD